MDEIVVGMYKRKARDKKEMSENNRKAVLARWNKYTKTCNWCGKKFSVNDSVHDQYCSESCYNKYHQKD